MTPGEEVMRGLAVAGDLAAVRGALEGQGVRIVYKDQSRFWRALAWAVTIVTFGRLSRAAFLNSFTTTLGRTIALPRQAQNWSDLTWLEVLTHEAVHVLQFRRFTPVLFGVLYLLAPLPFGLAYFRYWAEREAYAVGFRAYLQHLDPERAAVWRVELIDHAVRSLAGSSYGWAWPFPGTVRRWFEAHV